MDNVAVIVAKGGLARLKEMTRVLAAAEVEARVLPPEDGCLNG